MKITILGCGTSGGVPTITGDWGACDSTNPKNRRTRQSIAVEYNNKVVLIDTSPDIRFQLLRENIQTIDAILYTHAHADHCHGIDDVRDIYFKRGKQRIPVYADQATLDELHLKFSYLFYSKYDRMSLYPALLDDVLIQGDFPLFGKTVRPFKQGHGFIDTLGFRIDDFAYSTDVVDLDGNAFEILKGTKVWFVDCLQLHEHKTHAWFSKTLKWIEIVQPERAYLIHMNKNMDYDTIQQKLPENIMLTYDGLVVEL